MLKRSKYSLALLLAFSLVFGSLLSAASAAVPQDVQKHWAADTLEKWIDAGMIKGYPDGSFKPNAPVKRGELAALINRAFGLSEAGTDVSFGDLPKDSWAYQDIAVAVTAGYIHGSGNGNVSPNGNATRQEAAQMIASALGLDTQAAGDLSQFRDAAKIAEWSKGAVAALAANNIFKGDDKNEFRPNAPITRAEAVVALDAAMVLKAPKVYDQPGVFGSVYGTDTINGDVEIKSDGVTLQNTVINGNLVIAKEVGDGDVTLKNVTVKGTTTVNGGGENSVHLEDSVLLRIIVDKPTGKVRIVAIGATTVQDVVVNSSAKIEESHVTDTGFSNIELSSALPTGSSVDLVGQYEDVQVLAANIQLNIPSGSIQNLSVAEGASNNTINVGKEAQVLQLVLDAVTKLIGQGKIDNATINDQGKGSSFETKPGQLEGSGKDNIVTPPIGAGGTSSGEGSGGGNSSGNGICTSACDDASLHSLSIASDVYGFQLLQLNASNRVVGTGFSSDSMKYSIGVPNNLGDTNITISVTSAAYASIYYEINYDDGTSIMTEPVKGQNSIDLLLKQHHDVNLNLYVESGDHIRYKFYSLIFYYDRDLQSAFRLEKIFNGDNEFIYSFQTSSLEPGDEVTVTVPGIDTKLGTDMNLTRTIGDAGATYISMFAYTNEFNPHSLVGQFHVLVKRANSIIMDGDYQYDLTPLPRITDGSGIDIYLLNRTDLDFINAEYGGGPIAAFGLRITIDKSHLPAYLQAAKMDFELSEMTYTDSQPRNWTSEDVKTSYNKLSAVFAHSTIQDGIPHMLFASSMLQPENNYLFVRFYDAANNPIGYYVYGFTLDADHIDAQATLIPTATRPAGNNP